MRPSIEYRMDLWLAEQAEDAGLETEDERREYVAAMRKTLAFAMTQFGLAVGDLIEATGAYRALSWLARRLP